jgi:hypothetical protein
MATPSDSNSSPPADTSNNVYEWVDRKDTPALNVLPARSIPLILTSHTPHEHDVLAHCHGPLPSPQSSGLSYSTDTDTDTDSISSLALDPGSNTKVGMEMTLVTTMVGSSRFYTPSTVLDTRTPTYAPYESPVIASTTTSPSSSHSMLKAQAQGCPSAVHTESDLIRVALNNATNAQRDIDEAVQAQVQIQSYPRLPDSQSVQNIHTELDQGRKKHVDVCTALDNPTQAQRPAEESCEQLYTQSQRYAMPRLRSQSHAQPDPQHPHRIYIGSQAVHVYANPHPSVPSLAFPHSHPFSQFNYAPNSDPEPFNWRPVRQPTDQYVMERRNREKAQRAKHCKYTAVAVSIFLALLVALTVVLVLVFKYRKEKEEEGKSGGPWSNRMTYWQEGRG